MCASRFPQPSNMPFISTYVINMCKYDLIFFCLTVPKLSIIINTHFLLFSVLKCLRLSSDPVTLKIKRGKAFYTFKVNILSHLHNISFYYMPPEYRQRFHDFITEKNTTKNF